MAELLTKKDKMQTVRDLLKEYQPQLTAALPVHKKRDAERMARIVLTEIARNPRLLECTPQSLMGAILQAAAFGLDPGIMGDCWLIPRKNNRKGGIYECNFQLGYKGLLKLARRSGDIGAVQARVVHEKDSFEYGFGLKPKLEHVPSSAEDAGEAKHVYAVIHLKDGTGMFDVWTKGQIDAHRKRYSQQPDDGAWVTSWDEMAKKTVLIRVCKLAPASVELQSAIALDEMDEIGEPQDLSTLIEPTETVTVSKLERVVDEKKKQDEAKTNGKGEVKHGETGRVDPADGRGVEGQGADASAHDAGTGGPEIRARGGKEDDGGGRERTGHEDPQGREVDPGRPAEGRAVAVAAPSLSGLLDVLNTLYAELHKTTALDKAKREREFLWSRYVGPGVDVEKADPVKVQKLIDELTKIRDKKAVGSR